MQSFKHIVLLLAFGLVLMHSIIPHHHSKEHEECVKEVAVEEYSLLSFLTEAFHLDLGDENHLESYSGSSSDFSPQHFCATSNLLFQEVVPCTITTTRDYRAFTIIPSDPIECVTRRGPPFTA